jgi:hypothetical protein
MGASSRGLASPGVSTEGGDQEPGQGHHHLGADLSLLAVGLGFLVLVATFTVGWMISEKFALAAMGIYLVLGVLLIRVLLDVLERRMIAPTPEACWAGPEDSVER